MRGPHFRFLVNTLRRGQAFFPHSLSLRTQKQSEIMRGDCYLILYTGKRRPQSEDLTEAGGWRNQQFGPRGPHSRCCVRPHGVLISVERQTWLPYSDLPKRNREGQRREAQCTCQPARNNAATPRALRWLSASDCTDTQQKNLAIQTTRASFAANSAHLPYNYEVAFADSGRFNADVHKVFCALKKSERQTLIL